MEQTENAVVEWETLSAEKLPANDDNLTSRRDGGAVGGIAIVAIRVRHNTGRTEMVAEQVVDVARAACVRFPDMHGNGLIW